MKLLYCQACGDILAPLATARTPRWCRCGAHAIWWENPALGVLRLYERDGRYDPPDGREHTWSRKRSPHRAYVLGLHNGFLAYGHEAIPELLASTPSTYLFKTANSILVRIRPGESNDTDWADTLP